MADYQLTSDPNTILRISDGATIPLDAGNQDYQHFLAWVADGNQPDPPPISSPVDTIFADDPWAF